MFEHFGRALRHRSTALVAHAAAAPHRFREAEETLRFSRDDARSSKKHVASKRLRNVDAFVRVFPGQTIQNQVDAFGRQPIARYRVFINRVRSVICNVQMELRTTECNYAILAGIWMLQQAD